MALAVQPGTLHVVFTSECNNAQFDWFTIGVYESFRKLNIRGNITRLLACNKEDLPGYRGLNLGPTFVHPNYRKNPLNGDNSASYNKPASVMHWSREANFSEEFVLFIDADMLLLRPIDPVALGARRGVVVSERVSYMIGTSNGLAAQFLPPEAVPKAKPVGWYHIFHRDDLREIAPRWLHYCGRVRTEPQRYWAMNGSISANIPTGDAYVKFGQAPWIAEMYGYAFGAAEVGVDHVVTRGIVSYPSEASTWGDEPYILHYGIDFNIGLDYNWNKMSYKKLDLYSCRGRFFGPPPRPNSRRERYGAFVVNTLNGAFCDFYNTHCNASAPFECPPSERPTKSHLECDDSNHACWSWALDDQCELNKAFMEKSCKRSCGLCPAAHALASHALVSPAAPAATSMFAASADAEEHRASLLLSQAKHAASAPSAASARSPRAKSAVHAPLAAARLQDAAAPKTTSVVRIKKAFASMMHRPANNDDRVGGDARTATMVSMMLPVVCVTLLLGSFLFWRLCISRRNRQRSTARTKARLLHSY